MVVRPDSLANASATKVLPAPIGPVNSRPIGTRAVLPLADVAGDPLQLVLDPLDAADDAEVVLRLDELDQAEALALDDLALAAGDEPVDLVALPAPAAARPLRRRGARRRRLGRDQRLRTSSGDMPRVSVASLRARSSASLRARRPAALLEEADPLLLVARRRPAGGGCRIAWICTARSPAVIAASRVA